MTRRSEGPAYDATQLTERPFAETVHVMVIRDRNPEVSRPLPELGQEPAEPFERLVGI